MKDSVTITLSAFSSQRGGDLTKVGWLRNSGVKNSYFYIFIWNDWNCSVSCWLQLEHTFLRIHRGRYTFDPCTEKNTAFSAELISCLIVCQFPFSSSCCQHMAVLWSGGCVFLFVCVFWHQNWGIKATWRNRMVSEGLVLHTAKTRNTL